MSTDRTIHGQLESLGQVPQRYLDPTLHVLASGGDSAFVFTPPPESVIQVVEWFILVETTFGDATTEGVVGLYGKASGAAAADLDHVTANALTGVTPGTTIAAGVTIRITPDGIYFSAPGTAPALSDSAAGDKFGEFYLDSDNGDYVITEVKTQTSGGTTTGKCYIGFWYNWIKFPSVGMNASGYYG